jgi:hypothetical protein
MYPTLYNIHIVYLLYIYIHYIYIFYIIYIYGYYIYILLYRYSIIYIYSNIYIYCTYIYMYIYIRIYKLLQHYSVDTSRALKNCQCNPQKIPSVSTKPDRSSSSQDLIHRRVLWQPSIPSSTEKK